MVKSEYFIVFRCSPQKIGVIKKSTNNYDFLSQKEIEKEFKNMFMLDYVLDRRVKNNTIEYYWSCVVEHDKVKLLEKYGYIFINHNNCHKYNTSLRVKRILKLI